jgi:crotonobetainyl-CoA:carnitine CoA-transferase CaiB-like acyl-CoA transferase
MIHELFAEKSCDEWMDLLVGAAIPAGPVNNMEHLFADPQVLHRNMIAEVEHPTIGTLRLGGIPIKYSETPGIIRRPPPLCGQHTDEVLAELLDYSTDRIEELKAQGVVVAN